MENPADNLTLIDLPQPAEGFEKFISAWFLKDDMGRRILVDPGPAGTIPDLSLALSKLTDGLDCILLTHIHLDHSGGLGALLERYPGARVLVSDAGRKHLVSPEKLWKASLSTLGHVAEMYGEPSPVPPDVFLDETPPGIEVFKTPGHAPHHLSFRLPLGSQKLLFIGEAAGMTIPLPDGESIYLRPATPPKFDAGAAFASLDLLESVVSDGDVMCFAHFGSRRGAREIIAKYREQLAFWIKNISEWNEKGFEKDRMIELLLSRDPLLAEFPKLPKRLQARERIFLLNSLRGIQGARLSAPVVA